MFWRGLSIAVVFLAGTVGCVNSEADFQALLEENNALSAELVEVRQENEILSRALEDVKREQEELQLLFNAGKSKLNAGRVSPPSGLAAAGGDQVPGGDRWEDDWQAPQPQAAIVPPPPPPAPASAPVSPPAQGTRVYITKDGDVLSNIARANNTTVARILELNPNLRNRRNYMIYANERLRLP